MIIFTGVNQFYLTVCLAICFITHETTDDYRFALESYLKFYKKLPVVVYTDQERTLEKALALEWPQVKHNFCTFHICRNIQEKIGKH